MNGPLPVTKTARFATYAAVGLSELLSAPTFGLQLFCALQEMPSTPGGGGVPDAVAMIGVFFVVT